jgi:ribosomal protein L7/L12
MQVSVKINDIEVSGELEEVYSFIQKRMNNKQKEAFADFLPYCSVNKIRAIKFARSIFGWDLVTAKNFIEQCLDNKE